MPPHRSRGVNERGGQQKAGGQRWAAWMRSQQIHANNIFKNNQLVNTNILTLTAGKKMCSTWLGWMNLLQEYEFDCLPYLDKVHNTFYSFV
jgi:hypothetical protein